MKLTAVLCLLVFLAAALPAGDIATFVNLGFSDDSRYFMFGQYGADEETAKLYAELYAVDVRANRFVSSGSKKATYDEQIAPGQDGIGALITLYRDTIGIVQQHRINHMMSGRLLYLLVNGDEPKSNLKFRDFETGRAYTISLVQSSSGSGESLSSSFHINVTVEKGAKGSPQYSLRQYTVGLPTYRRTGVANYRITQVLASPGEGSLIFVIEKEEVAKSGVNVRFMVETLQLD